MKNIVVLGSGMVGSAMAIDLSKNHNVTVSDIDQNILNKVRENNKELKILCIDVTNESELKNAIAVFDLVVCAVPGFLGYKTLKTIIEAKKDVVDISFFPENALKLNTLAVQNKVTAIVDCGVAPGMGNIILGHYNELLKISSFDVWWVAYQKQKNGLLIIRHRFHLLMLLKNIHDQRDMLKTGK